MGQIAFRMEGNKTFFSCGCKTEIIGENYLIAPCSLDCEVYLYVLEQSNRQGNILSYHVSKKTPIADNMTNSGDEK